MDLAQGLSGKFFINSVQSQQGPLFMRGQILGPIANEMSPYYLCDLYPANDEDINIGSQTLLSLDQLTGVQLYADRETQNAAWDEIQRQRRAWVARQKAAEAEGPTKVMFGTVPPEIAEALGVKPTEEAEEEPPKKLRTPRRRRKPTEDE